MSGFTTSFSGGVWIPISGEIPALSTVDLDALLLSAFRSKKYILSLFNDTQDKSNSREMLVRKFSGNSITRTVYGKIGDTLDVGFNVVVDSGNVVLRVSNNESFDVSLRGYKLFIT